MSVRIVIIGAGEVGYNLAKTLSKDNYDLTIIDIDDKKCQRIKNSIDAHVILGDGASQRILQGIEIEKVDYLLALSRIDEVNLVAAKSAFEMGAKKIICRLRNTEYSHRNAIITPEQFGINHVVYPERSAQKEIEKLIRQPSAIDLEDFKNGKIQMVGIHLDNSSPLIGRNIESIESSNPYIPHKLVLIIRDNEGIIPVKKTIYKSEDLAYFIGKPSEITEIQRMAGKGAFKVKNIMILGAGKIGRLLSKSLESDYDVRIIENNHEKAKKIGQKLSDTLILDADGLDIDFLTSENIQYDRWKKLLWNAPFNPLSVVTGGKNTKEIIEDPDLYKRSKAIMKEVQTIAKVKDVTLEDYLIEKNLSDTLKMTPYKTSMLLDYEAGRPLETEAIIGNIIRIANQTNIKVPNIQNLYEALQKLKNSKSTH